MKKILLIARRDFLATVATRGFIIAVMLPPAMFALLFVFFPRLVNGRPPAVNGRVAVIDQTGLVAGDLRRYIAPKAIAERRATELQGLPAAALSEVPQLEIADVPPSDLLREKDLLRRGGGAPQHIAVLVIDPDAVIAGDGKFGDYDLFVAPNLDNRIQRVIRDAVTEAIISARLNAAGLDKTTIDALTTVERGPSITVTDAGESETSSAFNRILPMTFAILLLVSVMSSGQYLLTTTIEEKSSRTMEVILSAVSPFELLTGKILAQLVVGLAILTAYASIGILGLVSAAMYGLLDPWLIVYLVIFFLITYVVMGSLMAAIGSAVNELREAQTLMTPITLLMVVPWLFAYPIAQDPNSVLATTISFIPPMNAVAMLLRMTSTAPPPMWQVWLSIAVGAAAAVGALWFASRVFKIGLLMHGRPPNIATLIKWARQS